MIGTIMSEPISDKNHRMVPFVFEELKDAVIGIAGLGGLGSAVSTSLARVGVGKLILADFDHVDGTNINRQHYFLDQVGMLKTDASRVNLSRINPDVNIETHSVRLTPQNIPTIFEKADVIVECLDQPDQKQMFVETVLIKMDRPLIIAASGLAGYGRSNTITTRMVSGRFVLVGDGESEILPGTKLVAPRVAIAANHQANAVIEMMVGNLSVG